MLHGVQCTSYRYTSSSVDTLSLRLSVSTSSQKTSPAQRGMKYLHKSLYKLDLYVLVQNRAQIVGHYSNACNGNTRVARNFQ